MLTKRKLQKLNVHHYGVHNIGSMSQEGRGEKMIGKLNDLTVKYECFQKSLVPVDNGNVNCQKSPPPPKMQLLTQPHRPTPLPGHHC